MLAYHLLRVRAFQLIPFKSQSTPERQVGETVGVLDQDGNSPSGSAHRIEESRRNRQGRWFYRLSGLGGWYPEWRLTRGPRFRVGEQVQWRDVISQQWIGPYVVTNVWEDAGIGWIYAVTNQDQMGGTAIQEDELAPWF